jgi:hypothetical protein
LSLGGDQPTFNGICPMQYRVIAVRQCFSQKGALERLVKEVNEAIALGWEPQGGITVYGVQLMQAMIKRR